MVNGKMLGEEYMSNFVNLITSLTDAIESAINNIVDFDPTIIKHVNKKIDPKPGRYVVNIIPTDITPDQVTSRSSYPIININVHLRHFIEKNDSYDDAYLQYLDKLNKIYNVLDHNTFNELVSTAFASVDLNPLKDVETEMVIYKIIKMEYREYSST